MCSSRLRKIAADRHHIGLEPEAEPNFQHPYRVGPKHRKVENEEITRMLPGGVIEPAQSE